MLAFFRRALGSWYVLGLFGIILIAFIVTGVSSPSGMGGLTGPGADNVATVDGKAIPTTDIERRAQNQLAQARQQQPDLDMTKLLAAVGGVGPIVDQYISGRTLEAWATRHGIVASDRLIDGEVASIPAFQGTTGRFDEKVMRSILAQQRISEVSLRDGMRGDLIRRQLLIPISAGIRPTPAMIEPYAGVLVANRSGLVGMIPAKPEAVKPPTDADVAGWYKSHIAAYSLPERRVLRYAALDIAPAVPTDAEIAAQYKADAAKYAPSAARTLSQVILPSEAAAKALAAKVQAGTPFADAAAAAGFAAKDIALGEQQRDMFETITSKPIADAAFTASAGAITAPLKSVLGWHVVHVDAINDKPGKTLEQAKADVVADLVKMKRAEGLSALATKIEDAVGDGATFDEIVKANALKVATTPALTATGVSPADPAFKPDPVVTALLKPGFVAGADDEPSLERTGPDGAALLDVARIDAAAPVPLAQVRPRILQDLIVDRAQSTARATAKALLDQINKGGDMAAAFAKAGLAAPAPISASQLELSRMQQAPAAARTLFQIPPGKATLAPAPTGWFIIKVLKIDPAAPQMRTTIAQQMRADLGRAMGDELLEQFSHAAAAEVTVKRNPKAIADLGKQLTGQAPAEGQ
ncbi:SurA N-terminal domain-containing protein [Sphingomonas sp. BIUV-7]|uniref:Parvulin-like PPIase n=1 Tax=Sphingomonas natans TaxID=3063330 RepID=A0ABT8YEQ6_9SPHN|nr:peptidylprolyl isomerase [Sphingomonas sp. BIUV-7]MDO6416828.1 SurA N-terminal domain-containing protein [Sphingomonas sp. BIUV-7]